jgi:hypothetical protein
LRFILQADVIRAERAWRARQSNRRDPRRASLASEAIKL